jgi:invasion protein IalB
MMSRTSILIALPIALGACGAVALAAGSPASGTGQQKPVVASPHVVLAQAAGTSTPAAQDPATQHPAAQLPGGATALQETYSDWIVRCRASGGSKTCALSQQQTDSQSGQRVLALEVGAAAAKGSRATLVLPFGLKLGSGVTLQVDDGGTQGPHEFKTCIPAGCIVELSLDGKTIEAWGKGTTLKLKTVAAETGKEVQLAISLKGFAPARDRVASLAR